jgi:predicted transcriptional regulator
VANEIQLISDGDGLAVIGDPAAVERFLTAERLPSRDLGLKRLTSALGTGSKVLKAGADLSEKSGRWVQLSAESAKAMEKFPLMTGSESGLSRAVLTDHGKINGLLEIVTAPSAMLTNPAILSGAAGLMAQLAMKQTMEEITEYLAVIDAKVDAVLRAQTDAVVADMIGVELVLDEALTIREQVGRVSEVTWSKVQATPVSLARTQAYALRQLDAVAERLESTNVGELARTTKEAEVKVREWLAVLARCFQLQDAVAVIELDRVLDAAPHELEQHRVAIRTARHNRIGLILGSTGRLLARMDAATVTANAKVLLNPASSRAVVQSANHLASAVVDFNGCLGRERARKLRSARSWLSAAVDVRDKVLETGSEVTGKALETGAEGATAAGRFGMAAFGRARSMVGRAATDITEQAQRQLGGKDS